MHYQAPIALTAALASSLAAAATPGESLYDLARRDCPVGSPGIPQYLRCITECRVASGAEDVQKRCVETECCGSGIGGRL